MGLGQQTAVVDQLHACMSGKQPTRNATHAARG